MVDDKKYEGKGSSKNTDSKITDTPQKLDSNSETLTLFETKVQTYFTGQDKPYDSGLARQLLTELKVTTETLSLLSVEDFANKLMNYDGKTNGTNGNGQTYAMIVDKLGGSKARLILNAREDIEKDFWKDMEDYENLPEEQKRDLRTQYLTLVGSRANFAQGQKIQEKSSS
ncbi:MAG: hypothetical protein U9R08_05215 [Nanoarchaeota archaeon]|nr:hypothetical protein [Nanoarchaeota archaeon]